MGEDRRVLVNAPGGLWMALGAANSSADGNTCTAAAAMYGAIHAAEMGQARYAGWTPWQHFTQIGQLLGLAWPGPDGPC